MVGAEPAPEWLAIDGLLAAFARSRCEARRRYMRFVAEGVGAEPIWTHLNRQVYLGDDAFVARMQAQTEHIDEINVPRAQRKPPAPPLAAIAAAHDDRNRAILAAYQTGEYSYAQIAEHFGVHCTTVGRVVRDARRSSSPACNDARPDPGRYDPGRYNMARRPACPRRWSRAELDSSYPKRIVFVAPPDRPAAPTLRDPHGL